MSEFSINIGAVNGEPGRLNHVQQVVLSNVKTVEHAGDNLGSIGLADLKPNFQTLSNRLNLHAKNVESLSDALKKIVMKFEQTESGITNSVYLKDVVEFDIGPLYMDGPNPDTLGKNVLMDFAAKPQETTTDYVNLEDYNMFIKYDSMGRPIVDWEALESVLSKDASEITPEEYMALAYAYMHMPESSLGDFMELCMNYDASLDMGMGGYWVADTQKIDTILMLANYSLDSNVLMQVNGDPGHYYSEAQRNEMMERISALAYMRDFEQITAVDYDRNPLRPTIETSRTTLTYDAYTPDGKPILTPTGEQMTNEYSALEINIKGPYETPIEGNDLFDRKAYICAPPSGALSDDLANTLTHTSNVSDNQQAVGDAVFEALIGNVSGGKIYTALTTIMGASGTLGGAENGMITSGQQVQADAISDYGLSVCYTIDDSGYKINPYMNQSAYECAEAYNNLPDNKKIPGLDSVTPKEFLENIDKFSTIGMKDALGVS